MKSGDRCECGHYFVVVNTLIQGESRVKYLGCRKCGARPDDNKIIVPIQYAPPRPRAVAVN